MPLKTVVLPVICPLFCILSPALRVLCQAKNRLPLSLCCLSKPSFVSPLPRLCIAVNGRVLRFPALRQAEPDKQNLPAFCPDPGRRQPPFPLPSPGGRRRCGHAAHFQGVHFPSDLYSAVIYKRIIFPACVTSNIFNTNISNYPPMDWKSSFCNLPHRQIPPAGLQWGGVIFCNISLFIHGGRRGVI